MSLRAAAKWFVFVLALLATTPLWLASWIEKRLAHGSEAFFTLGAQSVALMPGHPGLWLRAAYYWATLDDCSRETHIGFGSHFTHRAASIQRHVSTGAWCVLGHVRIGHGTRLASRVSIPSGRRQHLDEAGGLSSETRFDTVAIGPNCWIGEAAVILADVGEGSLVGAGAVVTQPMPAGMLITGNPAAAIRPLPQR